VIWQKCVTVGYYSSAFLCTLFFCACHTESKTTFDAAAQEKVIERLMEEQAVSWNNNDLPGFMRHYWNDDSLRFVGRRGLTYGWQTTLDNYQKSYPDKAAMGKLKFTNLMIDVLDSTNAFVIGKFEVFRESDTLAGHYTLLWKKMKGNWFIVADHSS
jgi:ketosteroid isomerase-like protein